MWYDEYEVVGYHRQGSVATSSVKEERRHNNMSKEELIKNEDEQFINSLLGTNDDKEEETLREEEAQRIKNKNAEEARKRREAEAKLQAEKLQEEEPVEEAKEELKKEKQNINRLGEQLVDFKNKYPEVDLQQLDADKSFKRYIDGKLLGQKEFTALYEEFVEFKAELVGVETQVVKKNYIKSQSSSGSSTSGSPVTADVFSEEEMRQLSKRIPLMNPKDVSRIEDKLKRSMAFYAKK